jgi:hypothetical protein
MAADYITAEQFMAHLSSNCKVLLSWMAPDQFPTGARDFSILHGFQAGSGTLPVSYKMVTGGFFLGGKATGA